MRPLALVFLLACTVPGPVYGSPYPPVAVVENQFDNVQKVLGAFRVPAKTISTKDLEKEQALRGYKAVFFPCGMGRPVETSINLLAHGTSIQSVSLRQDYRRMDNIAAGRNIGEFIKDGGYAYFSGYSFSVFQQEFDLFSFYDDFPYQGTAGHIELTLRGDLENFAGTRKLAAFAAHSGWAAIRSVKDAEVLAEGSYETPRGKRTGPMIILTRKGKGEALYTAFHSDDPSHPVARFLAMRLVNRALLAKLEREADKWDQRVGTGITDTMLPWEHCRSYTVDLKKGYNTVYVGSEGYFHLDIYDPDRRIVASFQPWKRQYARSVKAPRDGKYQVRVFPALDSRPAPYALAAVSGRRILPYWRFIVLGALLAAGAAGLYVLSGVLNPRKYYGSLR